MRHFEHNAKALLCVLAFSLTASACHHDHRTPPPAAPASVTATAASAAATVSWTSPSSAGGSITYTVTSSPGGFTCTTSGTSCTVTGLTNGTAYTFSVTATNAAGTGPASAPSSSVTPNPPLPGAPTAVSATAGNSTALISWTALSGASGSVTYTATSSPGSLSCTSSGTSCTVTGLTNGTAYTFTVTAVNSAGSGPSSTPTSAVTPNPPLPGAPTAVTVTAGNGTALISWTAPAGTAGTVTYTVTSAPGGLTCSTTGTSCTVTGLTNGTAYTFTVTASDSGGTGPASAASSPATPNIFAVAEGPANVTVTPGNQEVTIAWGAPANTGTGAISSYNVTYGPTSGVTFTTSGCQTTGTSCTIVGLTNGTAYRTAVSTVPTMGGSNETGPAAVSSSVTPTSGLAVSPAVLALSGLGSGAERSLTVINTSASAITLTSVNAPSPALPAGVTVDQSSATDCSKVTALAPGAECTVTIQPGSSPTSSSSCTTGAVATPSVISIIGNGGAQTTSAGVVILGYGCQYQGGYVFTIDDTTPATGSIGGTVAAAADQAPAYPNGLNWSLNGALDSIWGIDDGSTPSQPDPTTVSLEPSTLVLGQMNCDGVNDGACNTNNIVVYYQPAATYAAGLCRQPLDSSGAVCTGGSSCYTDWYLPAVCELGSYGSTGTNTGSYPGFGTGQCAATSNMENELVTTGILSLDGYYWSSTEFSQDPLGSAWVQDFALNGGAQSFPGKNNPPGARCVRKSTL